LKTAEFRGGIAKETHDPAIVAVTMAKPGVVLRRPVGSNGRFSEHAELPKVLGIGKLNEKPRKPPQKTEEPPTRKMDDKTAREAALAFDEIARRKEKAAREKERKRREQAIANAERALEAAKREHESKANKIETDRAALDNTPLMHRSDPL